MCCSPSPHPLQLVNNALKNTGCPRCYRDRHARVLGGRSPDELYQHTLARLHTIRNSGQFSRVKVVWECAFRARLQRSAALRARYDRCVVPAPMNARRDALRGGRVEPFRLHYLCTDNEEIIYVDVVCVAFLGLETTKRE